MQIRLVQPRPDAVVVELLGEHDLSTAPYLEHAFASLLAANSLVVVDLSETEFIDSSTLLAFVHANRLAHARGVGFRLQLPPAAVVAKTLEIGGILEQIPSFPTRETALSS